MDRLLHRLRSEAGTSMIEVVAAAVILVVISGALTSLMIGAQSESGQSRVISLAGDLAQSELEQLRAKRFSDLTALSGSTVTVAAGGQSFKVTRSSQWASQSAQKATGCSSSTNTPSALRVSVKVDWDTNPRKPVQLDTLVAAPIAEETNGNFVIQVNDRNGDGVKDVMATMTGPETASGLTDADGCIRFGGLTEGTYTAKIQKTGYVDVNHQPIVTKSVTVIKNETGSASFEYDQGGNVLLKFFRQTSGTGSPPPKVPAPVAAARFKGQANSVIGTVGGTNGNEVRNPTPLWPQTAPYSVFSDTCDLDSTSLASATVTPAGNQTFEISLPQLELTITGVPNAVPASDIKVRTTSACGTVQPEFSGAAIPIVPPATDPNPNAYDWVGRATMPPGTLSLMCVYAPAYGMWHWKKYPGVTVTQANVWPGKQVSENLSTGMQSGTQAEVCTR